MRSCHVEVLQGKKTVKSNPTYRNQFINMVVNHVLKHKRKIIGLSNYLSSLEKDSTKDKKKKKIYYLFIHQAICGVTPNITGKARHVGGLTH